MQKCEPTARPLARRPGHRVALVAAGLAAALVLGAPAARAQQPTPAPLPQPQVGDVAPDFTLVGATRYGILRDSVRLSDFRGQTVVLAFFPKARTKG